MREQIIDRDYAIKEILVDDFQILHTGEIITTKGQKVPTEKEIQAKLKELEAEYEKQAYARSRQQNYPNEHDLLIALWEKVIEGRSESADALEVKRQKVKNEHPKPK